LQFFRFYHQTYRENIHSHEIRMDNFGIMKQIEYYTNLYVINVDFTLTKSTDLWWKPGEQIINRHNYQVNNQGDQYVHYKPA